MALLPYALLLIDIQKDFCPDGALPVPKGDEVVPVLNSFIILCRAKNIPIIATRDWHPKNHRSFKENNGPWPTHCLQHSEGAGFHADILIDIEKDTIISKGEDPSKDGYSGFENDSLDKTLKNLSIQSLVIGGLATEYCVKTTALDGLRKGYKVSIIEKGIKGVNITKNDSAAAIEEMRQVGAHVIINCSQKDQIFL